MDQRIALTVIGGFLGAGKSTLLNRILQHTGRRTVVLVNDFGSINVDAALVTSHDGDTINLSNGCACCSLGGGLYDALARAMARQPAPEWIVLEASGVAEPARIAQVGMSDPMLELESVLVVVDASSVRRHASDPLLADTIIRQLAGASVLLLSKTDLAGKAETAAVRQWLAQHAAGVPLIPADVDVHLLPMHISAERVRQIAAAGDNTGNHAGAAEGSASPAAIHKAHDHELHQDHETPPFVSWFWSPGGRVNARRLTDVLKSLPRSVVRAKGWLATDRHELALVQFAGGRVRYTSTPPGTPIPGGLVMIAAGEVDQSAINQMLQTAIGEQ